VARLVFCLILCCSCILRAQQPAAPQRSQVYYGSGPDLMDGYDPDGPAVEALTDQLVMAATGQKTVAAAWRGMVAPADHIGIKVSVIGGRDFSTHAPILRAVLRGIAQAGVPMSQVVIWDRTDPAVVGYQVDPDGPALRFIEPFTGYDPKAVIALPATGRLIWGDLDFRPRGPNPLAHIYPGQYSVESHWCRLICGLNKIINIPVMASSEDCGMAGSIYNMTAPNVDNWRRFVTGASDPYLAELYSDPHAGPKVVLTIMDGLVAQFGGGPKWEPDYSWIHSTIYVSKDPVAIDATALRQIEQWRKEAKLPPLTDHAKYLQTAAAMGLGNYNENQIDLVKEER
jgi:hypothetical protein